MVAHGTPCLGPVTQAGCGAICPAFDRGCYGWFGPLGGQAATDTGPLIARLRGLGMTDASVKRVFSTFNAAAPAFAAAARDVSEPDGSRGTPRAELGGPRSAA